MPMDAYREEDQFIVHFDLPGVAPEAIELDVERSVLTVKARSRSPARTSAGNWPADPRARRPCSSSTNRGLRAGVTNSGGNGGKGAC
jgi:HSP20 family molecular chaperone IbpA